MRYFKIPGPITVDLGPDPTKPIDEATGKRPHASRPFLFEDFIRSIADDQKLGATLAGVRTSVRLMEAVEGKAAGTLVKMSDPDFEKIKAIVEEPSGGYLTPVLRQILPFVDAVLEAKDEPPKDA